LLVFAFFSCPPTVFFFPKPPSPVDFFGPSPGDVGGNCTLLVFFFRFGSFDRIGFYFLWFLRSSPPCASIGIPLVFFSVRSATPVTRREVHLFSRTPALSLFPFTPPFFPLLDRACAGPLLSLKRPYRFCPPMPVPHLTCPFFVFVFVTSFWVLVDWSQNFFGFFHFFRTGPIQSAVTGTGLQKFFLGCIPFSPCSYFLFFFPAPWVLNGRTLSISVPFPI